MTIYNNTSITTPCIINIIIPFITNCKVLLVLEEMELITTTTIMT